jgi:KipI family sensor histidine kinase inhibitor
MYDQPKFLPAGDQAVSVEFGDEISVEVNARVLALERLIQQNAIRGVRETVPSFRALLVYYDPLVIGWEDLVTSLSSLLAEAGAETLPPNRLVELPCCYGGELGADLAEAASRLGLSADELIRLHATAEYLVYFIGFTPGMPYLGSLGQPLTIPRLTTPRAKTPAGSVGNRR